MKIKYLKNVRLALFICGISILGLTPTSTSHAEKTPLSKKAWAEDIQEACDLITSRYVYFDQKIGGKRGKFKNRCYRLTKNIAKGDEFGGFVEAMKTLRSWLPDGHVNWELDEKYCARSGSKHLPIITTWANDKLRVASVESTDYGIEKSDEILEWNGRPSKSVIDAMAKCEPQSTPLSSKEIAARNLSLKRACRPCGPIEILTTLRIRKQSGKEKTTALPWLSGPGKITNNGYRSIHSKTPSKLITKGKRDSLQLYSLKIAKKKIAVLHPLDFNSWNAADLNALLKEMKKKSPNILVIDLRDTAGGSFEPVQTLANAIEIEKPLIMTISKLDLTEKEPLIKTANVNIESDTVDPSNVWKGAVILITNPICGSGCDFFARWVQLNKRGDIIGTPTNGRGGGYDDFTLKNSKTTFSLPLRDWKIEIDSNPIEGHPVEPDLSCREDLKTCLMKYLKASG